MRSNGPRARDQLVLVGLERRGAGVLVLPRDWELLDKITGARRESQRALTNLTRAGLVRRVRRGVYAVTTRAGTLPATTLEILGAIDPRPYFVTAGRALAECDLSDQSFRVVLVLSDRARRPWEWRGEQVKYARVPTERLWGARPRRYGRHSAQVARPERAILDGLAEPSWGVTLSQVAEAIDLFTRRDRDAARQLARAAKRYANTSLTRRLGFLVEHIAGSEAADPLRPLRGTHRTIVPLSPAAGRARDEGPVDRYWRVRENVPFEMLIARRDDR